MSVCCRDCCGAGQVRVLSKKGFEDCWACNGAGVITDEAAALLVEAGREMLGATLRVARRQRGLTMGAVGKIMKVPVSTVSSWENDRIPVPAAVRDYFKIKSEAT
jgi:hypothetical protein